MKLKLRHLTIALAAGALVAVLGLPDLADARRRRRTVAADMAEVSGAAVVALSEVAMSAAWVAWECGDRAAWECAVRAPCRSRAPEAPSEATACPTVPGFTGQSIHAGRWAYRESELQQKLTRRAATQTGINRVTHRQHFEKNSRHRREPEKYDRHKESQSAGLEQIGAGGGAHPGQCLFQ